MAARPSRWSPSRAHPLLAGAAVLAIQAVLTASSFAAVKGDTYGRRNLEATYHVLLTMRALRETPLSQSLGLPIVTLGQVNDRGIPWGVAVPNASGEFVYTSFPPLGFWAPMLAGLPLHDPGLGFIVVFNGLLAAVTGLIVFVFGRALTRDVGASATGATFAGLFAAALYLTSTEAIQSHGIVYWPQSLNQVFLTSIAFLLHRAARGRSGRWSPIGIGALALAACYTEWTGFVMALGAAAVCLAVPSTRRVLRRSAIGLVAGALAAVIGLLVQFGTQVGIAPVFEAWTARAGNRAAGTIGPLVQGWALSCGATVLALAVVLVVSAVTRPSRDRVASSTALAFVFLLIPLLENLLLQEHAAQFSFDRLKVVTPVALAAAVALVGLRPRVRAVTAVAAMAVAIVIGVQDQTADEALYTPWPQIATQNDRLRDQVAEVVDLRCAAIGNSTYVRGYLTLLFGRNMPELTTLDALRAKDPANRCGTVFITSNDYYTDLQQISSITVVTPDGRTWRFGS